MDDGRGATRTGQVGRERGAAAQAWSGAVGSRPSGERAGSEAVAQAGEGEKRERGGEIGLGQKEEKEGLGPRKNSDFYLGFDLGFK